MSPQIFGDKITQRRNNFGVSSQLLTSFFGWLITKQ